MSLDYCCVRLDFPRFSGHQPKSLLLDFYMFSRIPLRLVVKGRMQSSTVIEYLNILKDFDPGLSPGFKPAMVGSLTFKVLKKLSIGKFTNNCPCGSLNI